MPFRARARPCAPVAADALPRRCAAPLVAGDPHPSNPMAHPTRAIGGRCYGVTHARKVSTIKSITQQEAHRIIAEDQNRQRQHIGVSS